MKFKDHKFAHVARFVLPNQTILVDSYHCSRYNTQTKRLTEAMLHAMFADIQLLLKRRVKMPFVNVKLAGSISKEQKKEIAKEITETLQKHAHKPPSYTYIVFEEVKMEDWAIGGNLLG